MRWGQCPPATLLTWGGVVQAHLFFLPLDLLQTHGFLLLQDAVEVHGGGLQGTGDRHMGWARGAGRFI